MTRKRYLAAAVPLLAAAAFAQTPPSYPPSPRHPVTDRYFDVDVVDDYRWLEQTDSPDVRAWITAQNTLTRRRLDAIPERAAIRRELQAMLGSGVVSRGSPTFAGGKLFAEKRQPPANQSMIVVLNENGDPKSERVVVDANRIEASGKTAIDWFVPSRDGSKVAVSLSRNGSEDGSVQVFDVASGRAEPDTVPRVQYPTGGGSVAWAVDGKGFFYTRYPQGEERAPADANFYQQVWFHRLGTPASADTYAIGRDFPRIAETVLSTSDDGRFVLADIANGDGGEHAFQLRSPDGTWTSLAGNDDGIREVVFGPGTGRKASLYALALKGSPRGRIVAIELSHAKAGSLATAPTVVPEGDSVVETMRATRTRLYVEYLVGGPSELRMFGLDGAPLGTLPVDAISQVSIGTRLSGDALLFSSGSYVKPTTWFRYDPKAGAPVKLALNDEPPFAVDGVLPDVDVAREFATSKDGTKIPVNILMKKGTTLDGTQSLLLTAYGGFGISMRPALSRTMALWVKHGGIAAVANLRGGGEFGEAWHQGGNLTKKQNVFDDFIAAAQFLIDHRYTSPARLAIQGGSNGGLLMGAVTVQRPELFRAVVSSVGLYDMLRSESSPNGAFNVTEFGSVADPSQFKALYAYSPLHHVVDGTRYPAMLLTTGEHDGRVDPWMSYKMTARLQAAAPDANESNDRRKGGPILLRVDPDAGHGMGTSLSGAIELQADTIAFLFQQLGMH